MLSFLALILVIISFINCENICQKVCNNNNICVQKCEEYAKNPNRNPLSMPHCGLYKLDNFNNSSQKGITPVKVEGQDPPSWPWIVSLQYKNSPPDSSPHFCTGVIINENFILSSANCVPKEPGYYQVWYGSNSYESTDSNTNSPGQIEEIESIMIPGIFYKPWVKAHEEFNRIKQSENNDILLIKTANKIEPQIKENSFLVNSICLPETKMDELKSDKTLEFGIVSGWGQLDIDFNLEDLYLKNVEIPLISNSKANQILKELRHYYGKDGNYYIYNLTLSEKDLVTMASIPPGSGNTPPISNFNGDTGSSVFKIVNERAFTLGVSHWISKGMDPISIWARISYYIKWLEQNIKKSISQI